MSRDLANVQQINDDLFGQIITGQNILVSEFAGNITFEVVQPILIDLTNSIHDIVTTFFTKTNPMTYIRTATTLRDASGNYAVNTPLNPASPAYPALQRGESFVGSVELFGKPYYAYYLPVFESGSTFVIGSFFIAINLSPAFVPSPLEISKSNVNTIRNFTGTTQNNGSQLVTKNRGVLSTETYQPILENLYKWINSNNTYFALVGDDFVRVATTITKEDNTYAIGTTLSRTSPAYPLLLAGKSYAGPVQIFGLNYIAVYEPMFDNFTGFVIGAYFSGYTA
jgi:hypothetical protein